MSGGTNTRSGRIGVRPAAARRSTGRRRGRRGNRRLWLGLGDPAAGNTGQTIMLIQGHLANADPAVSITTFTQKFQPICHGAC